jgi:hypothetical protein
MIEAHDLQRVGYDPFAEPVDVQLDEASKMYLDTQHAILEELKRFTQFSERQREKGAPTIIDLSPDSGTPIANTFATTTAFRIVGMLLSGGTGDKFRLSFGGRNFTLFGSAVPVYFTFPYTIQRGVDIKCADITSPASTSWSIYIFAYPE